jgi:hypothetical protein
VVSNDIGNQPSDPVAKPRLQPGKKPSKQQGTATGGNKKKSAATLTVGKSPVASNDLHAQNVPF